jgi:hypothetical protein
MLPQHTQPASQARRQCPRFARTTEGRADYARGWECKAAALRDEARCFGLSREQRATLLAEAGRATANAVRWREMARMLGASIALAS